MARQIENPKPNFVLGRVTDKQNSPLANLIVNAYDRNMRSEDLLAGTVTDKDGKYEITSLQSQLNGKKEADILIKVFTQVKNE